MNQKVRVRFAPSPTGPLHIGGVRTALYNYLFARKNGGDFILRIEDTDQNRFVPGAENYIIESLTWCGITFDEGVHIGGKYGPYKQSERKEIYITYIEQLLENAYAYYAFDTPEELDALRKEYEKEKKIFQYDCSTRKNLKNSLVLSQQEVEERLNSGQHYVVRIKFPENEIITVNDIIRGEVKVNTNTLDDKVLFKSDGMPTYHLANVVDDYLMEISHVIRGEEWLPSAPLHVLLYKYLGWTESMPQFAHLPLLLKPEGSGKLSKRDGDRLGFPVFPLRWTDPFTGEVSSGYKDSGYFPEAFINMLSLLGWNSGTQEEIFSLDELCEIFSLEHISKSGARFDLEKAKWFNQQYLRKQSDEFLANEFIKTLKEKNIIAEFDFVKKIVSLVKERAVFVSDLWANSYYFFTAPEKYDEQVVKKRWKDNAGKVLSEICNILEKSNFTDKQSLHDEVVAYIESNELSMGNIMNCIRLSLVGTSAGVDLFEIMLMIGKKETIKRIQKAIQTLGE